MKSMTGFGQHKVHRSEFDLEVSIRAVNGRFLEIRTHLPKEYGFFESELKKLITGEIRRGTVDIYIYRRLAPQSIRTKVSVRSELAKEWLKSYRKLAKELRISQEVTLETIASRPDVMWVEENFSVSPLEKKVVLESVVSAVKNCQKERQREGQALKKDLKSHFVGLEKRVQEMAKLRSQANKELEKRLQGRWESMKFPGAIDPQRISQEIVIQVDKADISEEISRLKEHLRSMKALLTSSEGQGKKMDFYSQELLREVNTIGSKSQVARLTQAVVDAKAIIERVREQVQNVE